MTRTPYEIREAFASLRLTCDPRGHDLLDALELASLIECEELRMREQADELRLALLDNERHSVKVG